MKVNKALLRLFAVLILGVAVLSIFQERLEIKIDGTTAALIGLAVVLFILPELTNLSKFKFANIELEFEKKVNQLEKMVIAGESGVSKAATVKEATEAVPHEYFKDYKAILESPASNIEKILRASQLVDAIMSNNPASTQSDLYTQFYSLRNQIIHSDMKEISDQLTARILDLLWRIVKIFN
jgi:hypothetical protein